MVEREVDLTVERRVGLFLGAAHAVAVSVVTVVVGGYLWVHGEWSGLGGFLSGACIGILHLLVTLIQVNRVLLGKIGKAKEVAPQVVRRWRLRLVIMGAAAAFLEGSVVLTGVSQFASPALLTAATLNTAMIATGTALGYSYLRGGGHGISSTRS